MLLNRTYASLSLVTAFTVSLAAGSVHSMSSTETIYGLSNAQYFKAQTRGNYYIQASTFKSPKNAESYKNELIRKYPYPALIKQKNNYYVVYLGPIHSADEVRAINSQERGAIRTNFTEPQVKPLRNVAERSVLISPVNGPNHFEAIGALGIANLKADDAYLGVTTSETDRLFQTNRSDWNAFTGQLGIGYLYYMHGAQQYSDNTQWFPIIEPEVNAYYLGNGSIKGDVWRFANPNLNEMTFTMPIDSYRLMLDAALTIVSKRQYSLYTIGGIGSAWNRVSYRDADRSGVPCADQSLNLKANTTSSFSWELGLGLGYAFNNRFSLSLEYLYTDLGKIKTASTGYTGTITAPLIIPADFRLTSQAALLGLHVAI